MKWGETTGVTIFAERVRRWLRRPSQAEPPHPFDVEFGVDTSGLYYADRLPAGHAHDHHSEGYYATAPSLFHGTMALWMQSLGQGAPVEDYCFVDLGCGKGRVVMMASLYPFRAVRGIELSADLTKVARRNLSKWRREGRAVCRDVEVECGDVLAMDLDRIGADGPVALFLFNSFDENVLRPLMERLAEGRPDPLDLIYVHPDHDGLVARTPGIELLRHAEIPFSEEDAEADVFGVASDVCSIYRCGPRQG
jgi:SAM-dependent methyltransferase